MFTQNMTIKAGVKALSVDAPGVRAESESAPAVLSSVCSAQTRMWERIS